MHEYRAALLAAVDVEVRLERGVLRLLLRLGAWSVAGRRRRIARSVGELRGASENCAANCARRADGDKVLFGELVVRPHDVVAAVLAQVVLVGAVLPQLVVQLLGVHVADLRLLRRPHLRPHVLPQVGRVEDVPRVGVHRAPLVALERLAVLEPLVQRVLGARVLRGRGRGAAGVGAARGGAVGAAGGSGGRGGPRRRPHLERLRRREALLEHVAERILVRDERLEQRELRQRPLDHDPQRAAAAGARRLPLQPAEDLVLRADDGLGAGGRLAVLG